MLAGLIAAFLGLAALGIWNQARYQDVRDAVTRYVALDERQEKEPAETGALIRQARPGIRRQLTQGEFEAALTRLKALEQEDAGASTGTTATKVVAINDLWPAGSPGRAQLKSVLEDLVWKQSEGFDMAPAQQKLVEVAKAARAGKRDEALAGFEQAAALVRDAPLRPGFRAPVVLAAATPTAPGATISAAELQAIEKMLQNLRIARNFIPQAMNQPKVTDIQRRVLAATQVLIDELLAAHEQRRDLRVMGESLKVLDTLRGGDENRDWGPVLAEIQAAREKIKTLPLLPAVGAAPAGGQPAKPGRAAPPAPGQPPPPVGVAQILQVMDRIRSLPEDQYQAAKPQMSAGIAQLIAAQARAGGVIGENVGGDLQLVMGPQGEIRGLRLFGEAVAASSQGEGGVSVQIDGVKDELPIRAPLTREKDTHRFRIENPQGAVTVTMKAAPGSLTLKVAGRRVTSGAPAYLNVAIPAQLGGWYWLQGTESQPMVVDREYGVQPVAGKLPKLVVRNRTAELSLEAVTGAAAGYRQEDGRLWVRLPLTLTAGVAEHTVRLNVTRRTPQGKTEASR